MGVLLAEAVQKVARPVARELLPLPIPFPENEAVESERIRGLSRAVSSPVKRRVGWQGWANAGVPSMSEIFGKTSTSTMQPLFFVTNLRCLSGDKRCRVQVYSGSLRSAEGLVSLPDPGARIADGSALSTGADSEAWRDWRRVLLRSPSEFHEVIAREGRVAPHTDPELKRKPQSYARLLRDVSLRGLVSFGAPSEATVGVFVVPKKLGKQRLIFDTRRVNQHFRRPWHCVLLAPPSWAGLQLPSDSAYHMVETGVNTAFHRILAPNGMSEFFILPSVPYPLAHS